MIALVTTPATATASSDPSIDIYNNGYGSASFIKGGDRLQVCDENADGLKVKATVQKYYSSTGSWQAVDGLSAPSFNDPYGNCSVKEVDLEPDSSVVRLHMWAVTKNGTKVKGSEKYSWTDHA